jgi:site-specific recombinase XerD
VLVLANSGIRTGEANRLKVTDVHSFIDDKQRKSYRLVVRGKTGERDAIVRSVAAKRLDKYLTERRAEEPAGLLFVMPDGSQIMSLIDQLNSALKEAGIERSSFGEKYSVYSLRHYYAVNALRTGVGCPLVSGRLSIGESVPKSIRSIETRSPTPCGPRSQSTTKIRYWG